jgi:D-alanyl-D-alanine carboxypeptidase
MTALVALESGAPLDGIVAITKNMTGAEGSSIYLYASERFALLDLIYALMLNSANDAAEAIAISVAGSIEAFAGMMNEKVKELGLRDTNFTNPHGLDAELHYTTAFDLAKISAYALENEIFYEISSTQTKTIYPLNPDGTNKPEGARFLRNHNKMLRLYKDAIGVKTGFTRRSGRCLVSAAERDGTRLVAVTINAGDDWNDHTKMLNYGFDNYHSIELCTEGEHVFEISIINGHRITADNKKEPVSMITCENVQAAYSSMPKSIKTGDIDHRIELPRFIYAPVQKGDIIGRIIFTHGGEDIAYSVIAAAENVEVNIPRQSVISRVIDFFRK